MDFIDIVLFSERENLVIIKSFHNLRTNELTSNSHHHQLCIVSQESPGFHHVFSSSASEVTGSSGNLDWFTGNFLESRLTALLLLAGALYLSLFALGAGRSQRPGFWGGVPFEKNMGMKISTFLIRMYMIIFLGWAGLQDVPVEDVSHRQVATCPYISSTQSLCARG